jgi:hypothetical protein
MFDELPAAWGVVYRNIIFRMWDICRCTKHFLVTFDDICRRLIPSCIECLSKANPWAGRTGLCLSKYNFDSPEMLLIFYLMVRISRLMLVLLCI